MSEVPEVPEHRGERVERSIRIAAPFERVWECWAKPEGIAGWFVDYARDRAATGGSVTWGWNDFGEFSQKVLLAEPGKRLVLQAWEGVLLEVLLESDSGSTVVTIVNSGFTDAADWEDAIRGVSSGWALALAVLKEYAEHHYGEARRTFMHIRPSPLPPLGVKPWLTDASKMERWFSSVGAPANVGEAFTLTLQDGQMIRGHTIASTDSEVSFVLEGEPIILELKAFAGSAMGPGPSMVGVRGVSWGADAERLEELNRVCAAALDQLAGVLAAPA